MAEKGERVNARAAKGARKQAFCASSKTGGEKQSLIEPPRAR
jgi:hypothetical protein